MSGVLVEYSRKRDSCSFLISSSVLKDYKNEFYIYSSNKFGDNKETAEILIIFNERILKDASKTGDMYSNNSKLTMIAVGTTVGLALLMCICCCVSLKCKTNVLMKHKNSHMDKLDRYAEKPIKSPSFQSNHFFKFL